MVAAEKDRSQTARDNIRDGLADGFEFMLGIVDAMGLDVAQVEQNAFGAEVAPCFREHVRRVGE
jgi:hypothetical protein